MRPGRTVIERVFGSWAAAVRAAGFEQTTN
jgi:hypothetical protein